MLSWLRGLRTRSRVLACSFCGRSEREVANLVAGPRVYICDACIDTCSAIITAERASGPGN
jgi:ATP-dependent Clp protease ATP-binding subunit ClpX